MSKNLQLALFMFLFLLVYEPPERDYGEWLTLLVELFDLLLVTMFWIVGVRSFWLYTKEEPTP